jgi:hypothetical protein
MKRLSTLTLLTSICIFCITSCTNKCKEYRSYTKYTPIIKTIDEVRASFRLEDPKTLENPRKIYVYGNYLMIVDEFKGFQILDNSDKTNPKALKFVHLDGCTDVAAKDGKLYANQGPDIIELSFSTINSIAITNRVPNVMNSHLVDGENFSYDFTREEVTEEVECSDNTNFFRNEVNANLSFHSGNGGSSGGSSGAGGSMARFSIIGSDIYIADNSTLSVLGISSSGLAQKSTTSVGWNVETIFGTEEYLFLGTSTGMLVYFRNQGGSPRFISAISHARGCDPVVVDGKKAYITVKGGLICGAADDELIVVDITSISQLKTIATHPMSSPNGLGVKGDYILICDGSAGLRIFDRTDDLEIGNKEISTITGVDAYDVIPFEDFCILSTTDGVYQYDYTDMSNPRLLSKIY